MGQFRLALGSCWDSVFSLGAVKAPDAFRSGGDKGGVLFFFFLRDHFGCLWKLRRRRPKVEASFWLRPRWPSATPSSGRALCLMAQRRHSSSWSEPSEPPSRVSVPPV